MTQWVNARHGGPGRCPHRAREVARPTESVTA